MTKPSGIGMVNPDWPAPANVRGFTTTRIGGFSGGPWSGLNLGGNCGDDPRHVEENRRLVSSLLPSEPRWLNQVHGTGTVSWREANDPGVEADAIFSHHTGQVCAVLTADCLPVLFCDMSGTRVAAAHAGWRGLAAGVLEVCVQAMDCEPSEILAWLGPAIGPKAFEVGEDVYDSFVEKEDENVIAFKPHGDRWLADLYLLARLILTRTGISLVSGGDHCTYHDSEKFFSYRRDSVTGRMASLIWLEK